MAPTTFCWVTVSSRIVSYVWSKWFIPFYHFIQLKVIHIFRSARFVTPDRFLSFPINTYESYPGFKPIDDITNRNPDLSSPFLPPHIALQPSPTTLPPTFDMSLMTTKSTLQRTTISSDHVKLGDKPLSTRPIVYIYSRTYFELPISNLFSINSIQMSGLSTVMSLNLSAMSSTICNIECDGQLIRGYISPSVAKKQNVSISLNGLILNMYMQ